MDRNIVRNDRMRAGRENDSKRVLSTKRILSRSTEESHVGEEDRVRSESPKRPLRLDRIRQIPNLQEKPVIPENPLQQTSTVIGDDGSSKKRLSPVDKILTRIKYKRSESKLEGLRVARAEVGLVALRMEVLGTGGGGG